MAEAPDIVAAVDERMRAKIQKYPCHTNRASAIGDLCERKLVYDRTHWEQAKPHDVGLQYVFELGNTLEEPVLALLRDAGYSISRQQEPFVHREKGVTLCNGHIDGVISKDGWDAVLEVKTMSPHVWDKVETVADFGRWFWTVKYPPQLNLYMFGLEIPRGVWILINKTSGRLKQIHTALSYEMAEQTLRRCERINLHVNNGTLPDFLPPTQENADYCEKCPYFDLCCPPVNRVPLEVIVDDNLIADVREMMECHAASKRFDDLKKTLMKRFSEGSLEKAVIGQWLYNGSRRNWMDRFTLIGDETNE